MLVLSRKKNERIQINDDISIMVVEIRGEKVRLGIEAHNTVPVYRSEVYDAIHRDRVRENEVRRRLDAGEHLRDIEMDLDHRDNMPHQSDSAELRRLENAVYATAIEV